jgi:outer membrane protein TolC
MHDRAPYRFDLALCLFLLLTFCAVAARATGLLSLGSAISLALTSNPDLAAIEARASSLAEIPDQAESLPDPRLSVNIANLPLDSFSLSQETMTQFQIGITQALPYPGKLALRSAVAGFEADAAQADVTERRLQLVRDVRTVWWNIFYLDRALDVISHNQALLQQIVNVAQTRYQVGQGQQQDILLAQLELSRLRDSAIQARNMRDNQVARMNALLDRPVATPLRLPGKVDEDLPVLTSTRALQQRAESTRPVLQAQQERVSAAHSRIDLAEKAYSPDFQLGAIYGHRSGSDPDGSRRADMGTFLFSMNLPLYSGTKQERAVDQRNAEWMQQKYRLHDQRNQVAADVQQATSDYRRSRERARLFRQQIIPQAQQTVDVTLAGFQVGKVDFLTMLRSQTTLYDYETQYWKTFSSANQALARLIAAVGEETIYE